MKRNYKIPSSEPVQFWPELILAGSFGSYGSAEDAVVDGESDFDSFFGV